MYVNAVSNGVMVHFHLRYNSYNIIFKIQRRLYLGSGSAAYP